MRLGLLLAASWLVLKHGTVPLLFLLGGFFAVRLVIVGFLRKPALHGGSRGSQP